MKCALLPLLGLHASQLRVAAICLALTAFSLLYLGQLRISHHTDDKAPYLVDGSRCRIADVNPFDATIQQYLAATSPVVCSRLAPLTEVRGRTLIIRQKLLDTYKSYHSHSIECCYSIVTRITQSLSHYDSDADKKYRVSSCEKFSPEVTLKNTTEFILVRCRSFSKRSKKGKVVYENMHATVPMKSHKRESKANVSERLNVLILGIDSVSRLNLRRTMPNTLRYLRNAGWFELDGYNKIADNTFPNLMALLAGRSAEQVRTECMHDHVHQPPRMDDCPSLWRDFRAHGYVTGYAEDVPSLATFNYRMAGFVEPPTDYYMRPFMLAAHALLPVKNKDGLPVCLGPQSAADLVFNYARDFAATFHKSANYFGIFWLNSFSHNDVNAPAALDQRAVQLLTELELLGIYNNTLVLFLSDHGIRFGQIRNSFLGFLEERLPFIFLHYPEWFLEKYPAARNSLIVNRNRLTSPYDVHATLREVLGDREPPRSCTSCHSLLKPVPKTRGCEQAGIPRHWCTCPDFSAMPGSDPLVQQVSRFLFETVLNRTQHLIELEKKPPSFCQQRTMRGIVRAHLSKAIKDLYEAVKVLVVVIVTEPFALFEATVQVEKDNELRVLGFISRLDSYFASTKCVTSKMLQFYCHCANTTN